MHTASVVSSDTKLAVKDIPSAKHISCVNFCDEPSLQRGS